MNNDLWEACQARHIHQKRAELEQLFDIVEQLNPRMRCLEIGTLAGGTATAWLELFDEVYCIDNGANEGFDKFIAETKAIGIKGDSHHARVAMKLMDTLRLDDSSNEQHWTDMTWNYDKVRVGNFDFIFHDGDHTYRGIRDDYDMYYHFLRPGGIFAIHDIIADGERLEETSKFWEEIKLTHKTQEILYLSDDCEVFADRPSSAWGGIGVIIKE